MKGIVAAVVFGLLLTIGRIWFAWWIFTHDNFTATQIWPVIVLLLGR